MKIYSIPKNQQRQTKNKNPSQNNNSEKNFSENVLKDRSCLNT